MSVRLHQQSSSYSSRSSISSSSLSRGTQLRGGSGLISPGPFMIRTSSVYGGAGGRGTRVSQSSFTSDFLPASSGFSVTDNEKVTMQNLNDRLASYLDKVRSLEEANRKLEQQIREHCEKKTTVTRDRSGYFATISDLRAQILRRSSEIQSIKLQMDNSQLAADDFKMKYEMELNLHLTVEADVSRLRGVRDSLTLATSDLEKQIEGLKDELIFLNSSREEDLRLLRAQQSGRVNVEVDSAESADLTKVLEEMREQYEAVMTKNRLEVETWFRSQINALEKQISNCSTDVETHHTELTELKKIHQSLEISRQSLLKVIQCLHQNLEEVKSRYSVQLGQQQLSINALEAELQQLKKSIELQQAEYNMLLDIKMRLEGEIAEYRRLLEGDEYEEAKTVVVPAVVEERKPRVERRVKIIKEEIIDGKVVSSVVDTQVEDVAI
ncbi:uncharacterized protein V6R79_017105 [Siganus canaliculatus]